MSLDGGSRMLHQHASILSLKRPACALVYGPVFLANPPSGFVWVSASCPGPQLVKEPTVAAGVTFLCYNGPVVVRPSFDNRVEMFDQCRLRHGLMRSYYSA